MMGLIINARSRTNLCIVQTLRSIPVSSNLQGLNIRWLWSVLRHLSWPLFEYSWNVFFYKAATTWHSLWTFMYSCLIYSFQPYLVTVKRYCIIIRHLVQWKLVHRTFCAFKSFSFAILRVSEVKLYIASDKRFYP